MDKPPLNIEQIRELLPHRYPMLLVDRVLEIGERDIVAEKLVSANDPFLEGHFPGRPIMPGLLILESLAQAACILVVSSERQTRGFGVALLGVQHARFRRPVVPGDIMRLSVQLLRKRGPLYRFEGTANVNGELAAETTFTAAVVDWEGKT